MQRYTRLGMRYPVYRDWTFWLSLVLGVRVWSSTRPDEWWLAAPFLPMWLAVMFTSVGTQVGWVRRARNRRASRRRARSLDQGLQRSDGAGRRGIPDTQ